MSREDVSLTDFVYGVVVGSAFQRIDLPLLSVPNALLLFAFLAIIDDWILYHAQMREVNAAGPREFAKRVVADMIVLFLWYCVAVSASSGLPELGAYLLTLGLFYGATALWEKLFVTRTGRPARMIVDAASATTFAALFAIEWLGWSVAEPWLGCAGVALWGTLRALLWRGLLAHPKEPAANAPEPRKAGSTSSAAPS